MVKRSLAFLLLANIVLAENPVAIVYIGYVNKIPATTLNNVKNYGKRTISTAGGQPYGITRVLASPVTNYLIINVSTSTNAENTALKTCEANGDIMKWYQRYVSRDTDGRMTDKIKIYNEPPSDMWVVQKSTPQR